MVQKSPAHVNAGSKAWEFVDTSRTNPIAAMQVIPTSNNPLVLIP
jgi:hypothetical protein